MMTKSLSTITVLALLISSAFAAFVFSEYSATPASNEVTVSWTTEDETGVRDFAVMRSTDDNFFTEAGRVNARGERGDYKFIDENVIFKSGQTFFYKIRAMDSDNNIVEETQSLIVNPNISGISRTWGAIKAMFR